jgi:hypothetical protein
MTAKDYIDTKGYWISPDRSIRRMGDEGGEQVAIAKATEECSDAESNLRCAEGQSIQNRLGALVGFVFSAGPTLRWRFVRYLE